VSSAAQGALLGLLAACGLLMVVRRLPVTRRPRLDDRLAPYLRDTPRPSTLLRAERAVTPFPTLERVLAPFLADGARRPPGIVSTAPATRGLSTSSVPSRSCGAQSGCWPAW
jgi:tight adherence protein C